MLAGLEGAERLAEVGEHGGAHVAFVCVLVVVAALQEVSKLWWDGLLFLSLSLPLSLSLWCTGARKDPLRPYRRRRVDAAMCVCTICTGWAYMMRPVWWKSSGAGGGENSQKSCELHGDDRSS